jgi:hypothetical protein
MRERILLEVWVVEVLRYCMRYPRCMHGGRRAF